MAQVGVLVVGMSASAGSRHCHRLVHLVLDLCDLAPDLLVLAKEHLDLLLRQSRRVFIIDDDVVVVEVSGFSSTAIVVTSVVVHARLACSYLNRGIRSHDYVRGLTQIAGPARALGHLTGPAAIMLPELFTRAGPLCRLLSHRRFPVLVDFDLSRLSLGSLHMVVYWVKVGVSRRDRQLVIDRLITVVDRYLLVLLDLGDLVPDHFLVRRGHDLVNV